MAMQILPARVKENTITYLGACKMINVTETLRLICDEFFNEETVFEDGEEITVKIVHKDKIAELSNKIEEKTLALLELIMNTNGSEAKKGLLAEAKTLVLFSSLIVTVLLLSDDAVLIIC